ncbi:MAG: DUF4382 domain-containing protein [Bacteroidales bacterium]|nr:DUF4382 domain-containing protein [Bacteroidales bacterium]
MNKKRLISLAIFGVALLYFTGCQEADNDQTGRIIVKITDAPFPIDLIDEASVTITRVEVRNEADSTGNPFLTLFEGSMEFNLLDLRNGVTADLLDVEIPVGNYNLIRIYVENASISVKDFDTYTVKVPSGSQTGIKVFIKPSLKVAGGLTAEVLLDFNVDKSFVLKGNMNTPAGIKGFNFKPVIRAVNNTTAGVVQGVVMDTDSVLLSDVSVWIEQDTVVTTAYTNDEGFYAMPGIPAGQYSLSALKEGFDTLTYNNVEVIEGNFTIQNFMLEALEE